jgi:hypothetical protein
MEVDGVIDEVAERIDQGARAGYERLLQLIDAGMAPREAIASVMRSFNGRFVDDLRGAFSDLLQRVVGQAELLELPVGDVPLSRAIYLNSRDVSSEVAAIVRQHAAGIQQARQLALRLYDGYNAKDGVRRPLEGSARGNLPTALRWLTQDVPARKGLTQLLVRGQEQAAKLRTPALRAAYLEAFSAWRAGEGREALNRRLDVAVREKNRFFANRIAVTELARANAAQQARELMADPTVEVVEVRINPTHPRTDICDLHARADLWELGPGRYPKAKAPQPTYHPFCRCRLRSRPDLDVTAAREVPGGAAKYLRELGRGGAARVMGSQWRADQVIAGRPLDEAINAGRDPAYHLVRLGSLKAQDHPLLPPTGATPVKPEEPPAPTTLDEFIVAGRRVTSDLPDGAKQPREAFEGILAKLKGRNGVACAVRSSGAGADAVKAASKLYPAAWNKASDELGQLYVRADSSGRGWAFTATRDYGRARLGPPFGVVDGVVKGNGYMSVRPTDMGNAIHEYAHRLQAALPGLDKMFQDLHRRRTEGDKLKALRDLIPGANYSREEMAREDHYFTPYQGKEYGALGAAEVMTMAFEAVLGQAGGEGASHGRAVRNFTQIWTIDREMVDLVVGLLLHWTPP